MFKVSKSGRVSFKMSFFTNNPSLFVFSNEELEKMADLYRNDYDNGKPFPSLIIDDFLPFKVARQVLKVFPSENDKFWLDWTKRDTLHQPKKQGVGHALRLEGVDPYLHHILAAFNSFPFLNFLEKLTGIKYLLSDPYFHGGGIHQTLPGGKLSIHTDFNLLKDLGLYRRINVILYLNESWKDEYGGDLELWNEDKSQCEAKIAPLFNRLAIFETNKKTFHGHPAPLNTPAGITRKSLALYYYTAAPMQGDAYDKKTIWLDT